MRVVGMPCRPSSPHVSINFLPDSCARNLPGADPVGAPVASSTINAGATAMKRPWSTCISMVGTRSLFLPVSVAAMVA